MNLSLSTDQQIRNYSGKNPQEISLLAHFPFYKDEQAARKSKFKVCSRTLQLFNVLPIYSSGTFLELFSSINSLLHLMILRKTSVFVNVLNCIWKVTITYNLSSGKRVSISPIGFKREENSIISTVLPFFVAVNSSQEREGKHIMPIAYQSYKFSK